MVNGVVHVVVEARRGRYAADQIHVKKALELDLSVIVCINKIDRRKPARDEIIGRVLELLMDLDASDEQLDCPFLYAHPQRWVMRYSI